MRKLTYYVACSLDGFIADPDGDATAMLTYLDEEFLRYLCTEGADALPTAARRAFGIDERPLDRFDTVIQGRGSYDVGLKEGVTSPYAHLRQYVASRTLGESPDPDVEIIAGELADRVRQLKAEDGGLGIYLCGGSQVAGELIDEIDELVLKTYPLVYGAGMPMFGGADAGLARFALDGTRGFGNGVLVRTYSRKR
ncbi:MULTISPECIES: dihydrofolate reductase family protein [unclassified Streptomyces]|uniref:dihydrofolate reductase family protein n=1 Tax=unclassified Streptomyces TaxID=2593676 RepID=UPI003D718789